jgi:hypothetical protein
MLLKSVAGLLVVVAIAIGGAVLINHLYSPDAPVTPAGEQSPGGSCGQCPMSTSCCPSAATSCPGESSECCPTLPDCCKDKP